MNLETVEGSIYDWPKYYEFVYGSDWQAECDFLQDCFDQFATGSTHRLFEPACGTGRLIYRLGKLGYQVSGLDLNPSAVEFCNQRFAKHDMPTSAWVGDMCDFEVKQPFDAAFNTINSFRHLVTDQMAKDHLKAMSKAVRKGGIYVLGLHLTPTEGDADEQEEWTNRRGHLQINSSMWLLERNLPQRYENFAIVFDVYTPSKQFRIKDEFRFRTYTKDQMLELISSAGEFEIAETFDFAYDEPIEIDAETQDTVFILKRK